MTFDSSLLKEKILSKNHNRETNGESKRWHERLAIVKSNLNLILVFVKHHSWIHEFSSQQINFIWLLLLTCKTLTRNGLEINDNHSLLPDNHRFLPVKAIPGYGLSGETVHDLYRGRERYRNEPLKCQQNISGTHLSETHTGSLCFFIHILLRLSHFRQHKRS